MKNKKKGKSRLRFWVGLIMMIVGAGAGVFFAYVRSSGLWITIDEAGDAVGSGGITLLILASLLLFGQGLRIMLTRNAAKTQKKFRINLPEI